MSCWDNYLYLQIIDISTDIYIYIYAKQLQTRYVTNVPRQMTFLVVSCLAYGITGAETYPLLSFAVGHFEFLALAHVHMDFGKALAF